MCARFGRLPRSRSLPRARSYAPAVMAVVLWACVPARSADAQSGGSLWSFLGIPTNAADQSSSNPAIAAAAQAKAAKHQICKKKKAIQYLAGMGCSPDHPEVAAALLAAMGDPDEPVRYEAVKAVLQTAGACQSGKEQRASRKSMSFCDRCGQFKKKLDKAICDCLDRLCGKAPPKEHKHKLKDLLSHEDDCPEEPEHCGKGDGNCCTPEIREKLQQLAYGRDDRGCFLEKSSRVRAVAAEALEACSACGGCRQGMDNSMMAREMAPADERELGPDAAGVLGDGDCVYDSVLVPGPMEPTPAPLPGPVPMPVPEPVGMPAPLPPEPTPCPNCPKSGAEPMPAPEGLEIPESIPQPAARSAPGDTRFAMLPGGPAARGVAPTRLPPRRSTPPAARSTIWNPRDPAAVLRIVPPIRDVFWAQPLTPLETARTAAGTLAIVGIIEGFGAPPKAEAVIPRATEEAAAAAVADSPAATEGPAEQAMWGLAVVVTMSVLATAALLQQRVAAAAHRRAAVSIKAGGRGSE